MPQAKTEAHQTAFDYRALMEFVQTQVSKYPFAAFDYLGTSILGKGIPLLSLGQGKRTVLYVGAHHGMEWITSMLLCRFLDDLCVLYEHCGAAYRIEIQTLLETHTLCFVPMLNVDGVDYQIHGISPENPMRERLLLLNGKSENFSDWQANARGVDLNHNYDAGFQEYKELERKSGILQGAPTRYSGESPESEPEVSALCNWIRYRADLKGILTLHSQGEEIFYKSRGQSLAKTDAVARRMSVLCGYRLAEAEGPAAFGGLTDWCIQKRGIPCFTLECGRGKNPLPIAQAFPIYCRLRQLLFAFPTLL